MDGYLRSNMKRKDLEEVNNDFSDFSLSSPARKIRRLDVDILPIIKEEESDMPMSFEQSSEGQGLVGNSAGLTIEELPSVSENQERSIVVFNPMNTSLLQSPSDFSISVNPDLISGLKNQVLWSGQAHTWRSDNKGAETEDKDSIASDKCLAVVPWVPAQHHTAPGVQISPQMDNSGIMDAEEVGEATMDIEADNEMTGFEQKNMNESGGMSFPEGLHQWQQQPCMIPQPSHNTATPIVWYR